MPTTNSSRKLFECKRCGHTWLSAKERPMICARCKSPSWNTFKGEKAINPNGREMFTCLRCDYSWFSILEHPTLCPKCKSIYYNSPKDTEKIGGGHETTNK